MCSIAYTNIVLFITVVLGILCTIFTFLMDSIVAYYLYLITSWDAHVGCTQLDFPFPVR